MRSISQPKMALQAILAVACTLAVLVCPTPSGAIGIIHEPPVDQTTRMGENATFTCVASGFRIKWIIIRNGETCGDCGRSEGFWFSKEKFGHSDHELMYMIVQATVRNNNTQVVCQAIDHGGVEQSAVLIVQGPPSPPILTLRSVNTTVIEVILEKPFSWPKYPVTSYSLHWDGLSEKRKLTNSSLTDGRYTFDIPRLASDECTKITVTATASNDIGESHNVSVSEGFPLYPGPFIGPVNFSVVFRHDRTPIVTISSELPYMCDYQTFNVTIVVTPTSQDTPPIILGPKPYVYSEHPSMREEFETEFESDMEYLVVIVVENVVGSSISGNYSLNTALDPNPTSPPTDTHENVTSPPPEIEVRAESDSEEDIPIMIIVIASGAVLCLLIMSTMVIICICLFRSKLDKLVHSGEGGTAVGMVPNPIYEGSPVYETIDPRVRPLPPVARTELQPITSVGNEIDESRYLDNPVNSTLGRDEVPIEKGNPDFKTILVPCNGLSPYAVAQSTSEDPYTIMSPAGRPATLGPVGHPGTIGSH